MFDDASEKWVLVWRYKYIFEIQIQNTECCDAGIGRRVGPLEGGDQITVCVRKSDREELGAQFDRFALRCFENCKNHKLRPRGAVY